jgi:thiol-disulfide isomerase/thioredoxin
MKVFKLKWIPFVCLLIFVLYFYLLPKSASVTETVDFTAKDISGNNITLSKFKGKVVLLDFWATWCLPCREEIPNLIQIKNELKDKAFEIVSIALEKDSDEKAVKFVKEHNMNWVHIINKEKTKKIADDYKIKYIPTMHIIGKDGKIVASNLRGVALKNKLKELLK